MIQEINPAIDLKCKPSECLLRREIEDLIPELKSGSWQYITRGLGITWAVKEQFKKGFRYRYTPDTVEKIKSELKKMRCAE